MKVVILFLFYFYFYFVFSSSLHVVINSETGEDIPSCVSFNFSSSTPCKSLDYTLSQGLQVANISTNLTIFLETQIDDENILFDDSSHKFSIIIIQAKEGRTAISNSSLVLRASGNYIFKILQFNMNFFLSNY